MGICDCKIIFRDGFFAPSAVFPDERGRNTSIYGTGQLDNGTSSPTGRILNDKIWKGSQKSNGQMAYRCLICEGQRERV